MARKTVWIVLLILGLVAICHKVLSGQQGPGNGIFVGQPEVYDDQALQRLVDSLRARLGQVTGLDQATLTSRLGSLQGASATTTQFSLQANGTPSPALTSTTTSGTPTVQVTVSTGSTNPPAGPTTTTSNQTITSPAGPTTTTSNQTSTYPTGATTTTNNQSITSTPSLTTQVESQVPTVTPAPPALPSVTPFSLPSSISVSASEALNEEMQLSYEIINLQTLLQGALDDEYVAGTNLARRHATIGFPISVETPPGRRFENAVAEIEVSVCDPTVVEDYAPPVLMRILPQEKTYNVATLVNKSVQLGAGAIIAGIFNVGGNFLWGKQTYYMAQAQDTVAVRREPQSGVCPDFQQGKDGISHPSTPVTFAWQFRPVLGQKTIQQGLRQTFVQISFPPADPTTTSSVFLTTRWRRYNAKTGVVGKEIEGSGHSIPTRIARFNPAPYITGLDTADNGDGTMTVTVYGHFLAGTRVRIGNAFLDETMPGFQNAANHLRFTAPVNALAQRGAEIVASNGFEREIDAPNTNGRGIQRMPKEITPVPFSDSLTRLTVPKPFDTAVSSGAPEVGGPYPVLVTIGDKTYGTSDAPFSSTSANFVTIEVPNQLVRTQDHLIVKRLFLGTNFAQLYPIKRPLGFSISKITVLRTTKEETTFAILGSGLKRGRLIFPSLRASDTISISEDGTYGTVTFPSSELDGLKQFVIQAEGESPVIVPVPGVKAPESKPHLDPHDPIPPGTEISYSITGAMLDSVSAVKYLNKPLPFSMALDKKSINLELPNRLSSTPGIKLLEVDFTDGSSQTFQVVISSQKAK